MKNDIVYVDADAPLASGVKVYFDTGNAVESFEGEGPDRVRILTPILGCVTFGPPGGPDYKGTDADYRAACIEQATGLLNPVVAPVMPDFAVREPAPVELPPVPAEPDPVVEPAVAEEVAV